MLVLHVASRYLSISPLPYKAVFQVRRRLRNLNPIPNPSPKPSANPTPTLTLTLTPTLPLPQGSHSLIWHHGKHRALPLHAELCAPKVG